MSKKQFKAESKRLLELMINSIYTHREIFLREIISNASDAEDKLCYLALTDGDINVSRADLFIEVKADKDARTLTVSDNGVGMTRDEMEQNLGTIAKSGSRQFREESEKKEDIDIIGQFGVGFYSAFMVASEVTVISRAFGSDEAFKWESSGVDGYTLTPCEKAECGTEVIMKLKEDAEGEDYGKYLEKPALEGLIKKYSDYIRFPIKLEGETVNSMIPLWQRPKAEVKQEDYDRFFMDKFYSAAKPLLTIPISAEGLVSFKALLFVPPEVPYDYYSRDFQPGLQLYSSGVLIMDKCSDLLPDYFRFVRGVVDTQDISLNISRELLQHNRQLKVIATNIEKRVRSELGKLMENDREAYEKFFERFGLQLKFGVLAEYGRNSESLRDLLMYQSSTEKKLVSLKEYVSRMPEEQKYIYYATGEDVSRIDCLPQTELIKSKGWEMLYMTEKIDEMAIQMVREYEGKSFKSVNDDSELVSTDKEEAEKLEEKHKDALEFIKEALGGRVSKARISQKLISSPVCLVAEGGISFEMEKYFASLSRTAGEEPARAERVLELNPNHKALGAIELAMTQDKERAASLAKLLYYQACLTAELPIENPAEYTDLVCGLVF